MTGLEHATLGLRQALDVPRRHHVWRWLVRHRLAGVKEALTLETSRGGDAWLAARKMGLERERASLLNQVAELGSRVLDTFDIEPVRADLHRLVSDLERHRQHLNDLVYDSVSLELGGSE